MKYRITLTEEQMRVTQAALEEYFRLRMGQDYDFVQDLIDMESDYMNQEHPEHERLFERAMVMRDAVREMMKAMFRIVFGPYGTPKEKTTDMMIAECIWDTMRFARGQSRWDKSFAIGPEPVPEIMEAHDED